MFLGTHQHGLDIKGRITIPAKYREKLGDRFVASKGLEKCISLYPLEDFQELSNKLRDLPQLSRADVRSFVRLFYANSSELEMDKQGRIVLPTNLREHAAVDKNIFIIGNGNHIEIWSQEKWIEQETAGDSSIEKLAASLVDLDI